MTQVKTFNNTDTMFGKEFSILQNEKGKYTLAIDGEFSKDYFFDKEGLSRFAKRNVKNLQSELQEEIMNFINTL